MDNEHAWTGSVLIVPSGIETPMKHTGKMCSGVLIVPSGIETCYASRRSQPFLVLIVPSGIETHLEVAGVNEPLLY